MQLQPRMCHICSMETICCWFAVSFLFFFGLHLCLTLSFHLSDHQVSIEVIGSGTDLSACRLRSCCLLLPPPITSAIIFFRRKALAICTGASHNPERLHAESAAKRCYPALMLCVRFIAVVTAHNAVYECALMTPLWYPSLMECTIMRPADQAVTYIHMDVCCTSI